MRSTGRPKGRPNLRPREMKRRRVRAARLLRDGKRLSEVAGLLNVSVSSVHRWKQALARGGLKALDGKPHPGPKPFLTASQREDLRRMLEERTLADQCRGYRDHWDFCKRVGAIIQQRYGVTYATGYIGKLLRRIQSDEQTTSSISGHPAKPRAWSQPKTREALTP